MGKLKIGLIIIGVFLAIEGLAFAFTGADLIFYRFYGPKYEAARRQVFEQTKSYRQGYIQELSNMQFEYVKADSAQKPMLADLILHRAADFPEEDLPADLAEFIRELKADKLKAANKKSY